MGELDKIQREIEQDPSDWDLIHYYYYTLLPRYGWQPERSWQEAKKKRDWESLVWIIQHSELLNSRISAILALGELGSAPSAQFLLEAIIKPRDNHDLSEFVFEALNKIRDDCILPIVPILIKLIDKKDRTVSIFFVKAVQTLGRLRSELAVPVLVSQLEFRGDTSFAAFHIVNALSDIGSPDAAPAIEVALTKLLALPRVYVAQDNPERLIYRACIATLGRLGSPTSTAVLEDAFKRENDPVSKKMIRTSLNQIATKKSWEELWNGLFERSPPQD